jgi:membrane protease YdiL (CAAX protease family)
VKAILTNKYFRTYLIIYLLTLTLLKVEEAQVLTEILFLLLLYGVLFTSIAYSITKKSKSLFVDEPAQKHELLMVLILVILFTLFITYYKDLIFLINHQVEENTRADKLITGVIKLLFIVVLPLLVYKIAYGFELKNWGFTGKLSTYVSKNNLIVFITFLVLVSGLQYFMSNGFKPVLQGEYSVSQILVGLPLNFFWLLITVGIVEEFFFRAFLQSRLSVLLKSEISGIILSAAIFGLAHAPGIYLRGGGLIANLGSAPSVILSVGYSFAALSVAGFFLAVIWARTKNFWLIAAIHALVDLLPGLSGFIDLWNIR